MQTWSAQCILRSLYCHPVAALVLALASSVAYGCADFVGGLASRRAHVLRVVALAAPASLAVEAVLWPVLGADWSEATVVWGAASGVASAAAFALLYRSLATGPMSVLSPITSLVSALLPVAVGLGLGEHLSGPDVAGAALAPAAILLVSTTPGSIGRRPSARAVLVALGAGAAIASQLVCLDQAPHHSGVAPLITGRTVSSLIVIAAAMSVRSRLGPAPAPILLSISGGGLDSLANLSFLLAVRHGQLADIAVITALYPASTLVLARAVLNERLQRTQLGGLAVAGIAVTLLTMR